VTPHELHGHIRRLGIPLASTSRLRGHDRVYVVALTTVMALPSYDDTVRQINGIEGVLSVEEGIPDTPRSGILHVTVTDPLAPVQTSPASR
jgi:hypothetical protein